MQGIQPNPPHNEATLTNPTSISDYHPHRQNPHPNGTTKHRNIFWRDFLSNRIWTRQDARSVLSYTTESNTVHLRFHKNLPKNGGDGNRTRVHIQAAISVYMRSSGTYLAISPQNRLYRKEPKNCLSSTFPTVRKFVDYLGLYTPQILTQALTFRTA